MNKRSASSLVVLIGVCLIWMVMSFFDEKRNVSQKHSASTVSEQSNPSGVLSTEKKSETDLSVPNHAIPSAVTTKEAPVMKGVSYLTVFRHFRQAQMCQKYIREKRMALMYHESFDFPEHVWNKAQENMAPNPDGSIDPIPEPLLQVATSHAQKCEKLLSVWREVFGKERGWDSVEGDFMQVLMRKKASSTKEKKLKELIESGQRVADLFRTIFSTIEGTDMWTPSQIQSFHAKIKQLNGLRTANPDADPMIQTRNEEIQAEVSRLYQQYSEQKQSNKPLAKQLVAELSVLLTKTRVDLNTIDPEVFLLAKAITEMSPSNRPFAVFGLISYESLSEIPGLKGLVEREYVPTSKAFVNTVTQHQGNQFLFFSTLKMAESLYYCSLGADCSATGDLMTDWCLGLSYSKMNFQACDQDLLESELYAQLTTGQLHDINWMLTALEAFYGQ